MLQCIPKLVLSFLENALHSPQHPTRVVLLGGIGCDFRSTLWFSQLVALSQHVTLSQLAAAAGGRAHRWPLSQLAAQCLKLCGLFIRVCCQLWWVSRDAWTGWRGVWLGVKVYLTTLPGSERQTVPQPPPPLAWCEVGDKKLETSPDPLCCNLVRCQLWWMMSGTLEMFFQPSPTRGVCPWIWYCKRWSGVSETRRLVPLGGNLVSCQLWWTMWCSFCFVDCG